MCGGRGTRLDAAVEKPLVDVCGRPMVDRVADALAGSRVDAVFAVVSPHAPATREHLADRGLSILDAPGDGYVEDLDRALSAVGTPAITVAADLPLLAPDLVDDALDRAGGDSLAVCVPAALKRRLGASADTTFERGGRELAPAGLNVVADTEDTMYVSYDARLAVNVNRPSDATLAEELCD
ncbi:NTP transferase domain-containing protein [Halegenticoccus tardaugens]|uniref:NTP transferase domain-containing protein n=1 Tax=Halegenticoccus tardaugens TaxID=2071624 RepID=UPI00100B583A|nr:NTP transferase domain-containing protein [Halegenticoccus tardaugens]